jgi:hypothetical protein
MNLESVKMGRIPKLVREKVLNDRMAEESSNSEETNKQSSNKRLLSNHSSVSNISIDLLEELPSSTSSNDMLSPNKTNECVTNTSSSDIVSPSKTNEYVINASVGLINTNENDDDCVENSDDKTKMKKQDKPTLGLEDPCMNGRSTLETIADFAHSIYRKDTEHVKNLVLNAHNVINSGVIDYSRQEITHDMIWSGVCESIRDHVRCFIKITNDLPGFGESICENDFPEFIDIKIYDYCILKNAILAINDEFYLILNNGIKYTRHVLAQLCGNEMAERTFLLYKSLSDMGLSDREYALLVPYALSIPSTNKLRENHKLCKINEIFGRALAQELFASKRSQLFVQKLYHVRIIY